MVSLRRAAASGIRYQVLLKISTVLLNQIATIVLARLLLPEDFGLVGVATIAIGIVSGVADFGLGAALIQGGTRELPDYETGATLRFLLASAATVATIGLAPIISWAYGGPALLWVVWALSPLVLLNFLGFAARVSLTRELEFRKAVTPDILGRLTSSAVAIAAAFAGLSYWSLVVGPLTGAIVGAVGLYVVRPWRLSFRVDRPVAKRLLRFGATVLAANLLAIVFTSIGMLALATFGFEDLGFFSVAYAWAVAIPVSFYNTLDNVVFPIYAAATSDPPRLRRAYLATLRATVWFLVPLGFVLSAAAYPIVVVLLGSVWIPSVQSLEILALAGWILVPAYSFQSLATASGRPRENLFLSALAAVLMVGIGPFAVVFWRGVGLSLAFLAISIVLVATAAVRAVRLGYVDVPSYASVWSPALFSGIVMYLLVFELASILEPSIFALAVLLGAGIVGYFVPMQILTSKRFFSELKSLVTSLAHAPS